MKKIFVTFIVILLCCNSLTSQNNLKKVKLLWDSSYGMLEKDLTGELNFLDSYFNQNPKVELQLVVFSNTIILEETFRISNGNWELLKNELRNTIYDGSASFQHLFNAEVDEILLVSDGRETIDELPYSALKPVHIICSLPNANENDLKNLALGTGGTYFNISKSENIDEIEATSDLVDVTGVVTDNLGPLVSATVFSRETDSKTVTDNQGRYTIEAKRGGILEYSYLGKRTVVTRVPSSGTKNVILDQGNEVLGEVIVRARVDEEPEEEELMNTGNTRVAKKKLGYAVESISEEDIGPQDLTIENSVSGQFSNINLKVDQNISEFVGRGKNMTILLDQTGIIVVDGIPIESSPTTLRGLNPEGDKGIFSSIGLLDPSNIADITVLKGLAATNKYGTIGRNGVILITTKNAVAAKIDKTKAKTPLGTTGTYTGDAAEVNSLPNTPYMAALKKSKDIDEAYAIYLEQRRMFGDDPDFFFDVASYFKDWNNAYLLDRILSNVSELPSSSIQVLVAQAYKYEEFGLYDSAVSVYERILKLAPKDIQNYRNLSLAYHNAGMYKKALTLYDRIDRGHFEEMIGTTGLAKTIANEFKNLMALQKGKLSSNFVNPKYLKNVNYDTRIVFEWNTYDAEFDLQIVNPQKRFFTWSHTQKEEAVRLADEERQGYGLEEFFMTSSDTGEWLFNMVYFGKRKGDNISPTYVKITTYTNFGKPNQTSETKVVQLHELNKKETVLALKI